MPSNMVSKIKEKKTPTSQYVLSICSSVHYKHCLNFEIHKCTPDFITFAQGIVKYSFYICFSHSVFRTCDTNIKKKLVRKPKAVK